MSVLPNVIIVGATRSGTSSLHKYLAQHPQVFMSKKKELSFFNKDWLYNKGLPYYSQFFRQAEVVGESTPLYLEKGVVYNTKNSIVVSEKSIMERIRNSLPGVKLVVSLRSPVTRYKSRVEKNYFQGKKDFTSCISDMIKKELLVYEKKYTLLYGAKYRIHLEDLFEHFSRDSVHVMIFEEWKANPQLGMKKLLRFLEVDPSFSRRIEYVSNNSVESYKSMPFSNSRKFLSDVYMFGRSLRRLRRANENIVMTEYDRRWLYKFCREDIDYVEKTIDKKIPSWHIER
ncbi:sulfotransferase family protein [Thiococcus pfennigii]|uniref:sulfotransferase family protein n=1 Tax=Thiococcus pfennigii TaxID=1057 RepID=UPI00190743C5|nr:sulfotransferase domain-containing protein [Thiococcus pfennigii]MBK1699832.1 hypothetical protein [Thiococcus pfennigii]